MYVVTVVQIFVSCLCRNILLKNLGAGEGGYRNYPDLFNQMKRSQKGPINP